MTRVEPSLQAAFVEYGGNRQGFLAFSEIHPDYYQIPFADRQALIADQEAEARRRSEDDIESFEIGSGAKRDESDEEKEEAEEETDLLEAEEEGTVLDAATIGVPWKRTGPARRASRRSCRRRRGGMPKKGMRRFSSIMAAPRKAFTAKTAMSISMTMSMKS